MSCHQPGLDDTYHLQIGTLAQELPDRFWAVPQPGTEQHEVADHDARPVLFFAAAHQLALLGDPIRTFRLLAGGNHQIANDELHQRHLVVILAHGRLAGKLFGVFG
jgi:hypothetical protein